jgi:hypothetical protein
MPAALCLACRHLFNKPRLRNVMEDAEHPDLRLLLLEEGLAESGAPGRRRRGAAALQPACWAHMARAPFAWQLSFKHSKAPALLLNTCFNMVVCPTNACLQTWAAGRWRESLPGAWRSWCRQRA